MAGIARVGSLLEGFLKRAGISHKVKAELALQVWSDVVGSGLASKTQAFSVRNNVMFIGCASPALAHHLSFMKAKYLTALADRIGPGIVADIRFQVRELDMTAEQAAARDEEPSGISLSVSESEEIERQAAELPQGELREAFLRASKKARMLRKGLKQSGWLTCSQCGTLFPPQGGCPSCLAQESEKRCAMARLFVKQHPWWTQDEIRGEVPGLSPGEFRRVKRDILSQWDLEIQVLAREARESHGEAALKNLRMAIMRYVMLALGRVPEELDPGTVERIMGKRVAAALQQSGK